MALSRCGVEFALEAFMHSRSAFPPLQIQNTRVVRSSDELRRLFRVVPRRSQAAPHLQVSQEMVVVRLLTFLLKQLFERGLILEELIGR